MKLFPLILISNFLGCTLYGIIVILSGVKHRLKKFNTKFCWLFNEGYVSQASFEKEISASAIVTVFVRDYTVYIQKYCENLTNKP